MSFIGQKIELFVSNLEQSVDFYRRVLAFEVGTERQVMYRGTLLRHTPVWNGPTVIGLGLLANLSPDHHLRRAGLDAARGVGVEFCLYVDDSQLDAHYERALRECADRVEALVAQPWGARDFRVSDPDGYYLRVSTPDRDFVPLQAGER